MKRLLLHAVAGIMLAPLFTACSKDNGNSDVQELNLTGTTSIQEVNILAADLVGTWNMYSMTSMENTVDFDQDGNRTNDLLLETNCFDPMYFIFKENGGVDTHQARLYFSEATGMFSCQTTGDYSATYEIVDGNELTITFSIDGQQYVETRTISLFTKDNSEFLKVTLTKTETNAAVYVAPDPGNTVASEIQKIEMVYIKQ
ncbi:lipocalin-like domain-containing protein [Salinimicrobium sediminilitoris]|uniref:lipocalin family protein n=1 Tax=Salinimicrobium sediminilitoris TaxID=2876715 RepID=UPI001E5B0E66|nr:lipocalin family protein [Salinimicrobium sediminilitoris]MCC8359822.1 lipocalin family protein [Salinimicrobium sediminilitoris]